MNSICHSCMCSAVILPRKRPFSSLLNIFRNHAMYLKYFPVRMSSSHHARWQFCKITYTRKENNIFLIYTMCICIPSQINDSTHNAEYTHSLPTRSQIHAPNTNLAETHTYKYISHCEIATNRIAIIRRLSARHIGYPYLIYIACMWIRIYVLYIVGYNKAIRTCNTHTSVIQMPNIY